MSIQKRILVIDDDPDFLSYVYIVLDVGGYEVDTASNMAEGLGKMRATLPDLVIVDVMLSRVLNGWTISHAMETDSRLAHIPILMVSAVVDRQDGDLFPTTESGQDCPFMSKPIEPTALLERVAELT